MITTEIKTRKLQIKSVDGDQGIFEAHAAVFGNVDSEGDIIEPGAFARTLAEGAAAGGVKILAMHNDRLLPVGKSLELREDDVGLYVRGYLSNTAMGSDMRQLVRDGVIDELSIGYDPKVYEYDADRYRHLKDVELLEISLVPWAANNQAKIISYKGGGEPQADPPPAYDQALVRQLLEGLAALSAIAAQLSGPGAGGPPPDGDKQHDNLIYIIE